MEQQWGLAWGWWPRGDKQGLESRGRGRHGVANEHSDRNGQLCPELLFTCHLSQGTERLCAGCCCRIACVTDEKSEVTERPVQGLAGRAVGAGALHLRQEEEEEEEAEAAAHPGK